MYPDFASIKNVLPQVIKKASASLQVGPIESLNVLHIGFATHCNNEVIKSALRYSKTDNIWYHIAHQARDRPNFPLIFSISVIRRMRAAHSPSLPSQPTSTTSRK